MTLFKKSFESVIENISEAIVGVDKYGNIVILNKKAGKLLGLNKKNSMEKNLDEIIPNSELLRILSTGRDELDRRFKYKGKEFNTNRIAIKDGEDIKGAIAIFQDLTVYNELREKANEDRMQIEVLSSIMNAFNEWTVVVDTNGIITMMSDAYKEFVKESHPEGKHVTEVIENTRMHLVAQTGVMEMGEVQEIRGNKMVAMRLPMKKDGKIVGAIGKVIFKDLSDFYSLSRKINNLQKEIQYYKSALDNERRAKYSFNDIISSSPKIRRVKEMARRAAQTDSNILICGESGTGKELYAHAIHNASKRYLAPFIKLNCAAIPAELLESELFGYEEGAFTGARKGGKKGKFEIANGGTILLDEIGDMPVQMQVKLLRVIQEKEIERVGGNVLKDIDVRIIASTNKDLEESIRKGEFRDDLYYRLNVMKITIPPLRDRKEDIPGLSNALRMKVATRLGMYVEGISKEAYEYLMAYDWPGNVRELENVIERAINLLDSDLYIKPEHLPSRLTKNNNKFKIGQGYLKEIIEDVEKQVIEECLEECGWNKNKASKILGISRAGLYNKIRQYDLENVN